MPKAKLKAQRAVSKDTVKLEPKVLKTARIAAAILGQTAKEFVTDATEAKNIAVLKKHAPELLENSKAVESAA